MEQNKGPDKFVNRRWGWLIGLIILEIGFYWYWNIESLSGFVDRALPGEVGAIIGGMVLGDESGFTLKEREMWRQSGLWHLAVASGSNLMWLNMWLVEGLAVVLGRRQAVVGSGVGIWVYTATLGWPVALVRASILMTIYYWSQIAGRRFDVWRAAGVGAGLMIVANPLVVSQAGFWLSMGAYLAVVGWENREEGWWKRELKTGLRVAWFTWPVLAFVGGKISLWGPITTMAVAPVTPVILGGGMINLGIAMVWEELAIMGWWLLAPLARWVELVAEIGSRAGAVEGGWMNWVILTGWVVVTWWGVRRAKG